MWYGPAAVAQSIYHVNTGLDNGTETSGYWFSFGDEDGDARVVWTELPTYETSIDPVVDFCKGICGTFDFTNEGVTGVGFNVAGIVSWEHEVPDFAARGEAGSQSKFNIIGVGKYADARNVCEQGAEPFVSAQK